MTPNFSLRRYVYRNTFGNHFMIQTGIACISHIYNMFFLSIVLNYSIVKPKILNYLIFLFSLISRSQITLLGSISIFIRSVWKCSAFIIVTATVAAFGHVYSRIEGRINHLASCLLWVGAYTVVGSLSVDKNPFKIIWIWD